MTEHQTILEEVDDLIGRSPQVFTSIPFPEVLIQMMLKSVARIEQNQARDLELLTDARERLIRIEQSETALKLTALELRLKALEDAAIERRGMQKLGDWIFSHGWGILLAVFAAVLFLTDKLKR